MDSTVTFPLDISGLDHLTLCLQVNHFDAGDLRGFEEWLKAVLVDSQAFGHVDACRLLDLRHRTGWGTAATLERHLRSFAPQLGVTVPFEQWLQATAGDPDSFWQEFSIQLIAVRWVDVLKRGPPLLTAQRLACAGKVAK